MRQDVVRTPRCVQDRMRSALQRVVVMVCVMMCAPVAFSDPVAGERLSQWLLQQPISSLYCSPSLCPLFAGREADNNIRDLPSNHSLTHGHDGSVNADRQYPLGFMWLVPQEKPAQAALKQALVARLSTRLANMKHVNDRAGYFGLLQRIQHLPVTGRAPIALLDARWLELHPEQDPIYRSGQSFIIPVQPSTVTVLLDSGKLCQTPFVTGARAPAYVKQCLGQHPDVDDVWVVQPDGRSVHYGIAIWNEEQQDPPAPGAWIWVPRRDTHLGVSFSGNMAAFLATQGPAADKTSGEPGVFIPPGAVAQNLPRMRRAEYTINDWGMVGLLQMPSARMEESGEVRFQLTHTYPYTPGSIMFQPFDWLEGGFRYVHISNRLYSGNHTISDLKLIDKGFDVKVKLLNESAYLPAIAIGGQDIAGTGPFSGEYLVASKRTEDLDWMLGLGWGYLGARGQIANPFNVASQTFASRHLDIGMGGKFNYNTYFHGPASLFGGVQWHTPWDPLFLKLEYDGGLYHHDVHDPYSKPAVSPINLGVVYRLSPNIDLTTGFERGNTAMLGFTLHTSLSKMEQVKVFDPAPPTVLPRMPSVMPDWSHTVADIHHLTGWSVKKIVLEGNALVVQMDNTFNAYGGSRFESLVATLHRDAPEYVTTFIISFSEFNMNLDGKEVNRALWVQTHLEALPPSLTIPPIQSFAPSRGMFAPSAVTDKQVLWQGNRLSFSGGIAPGFSQTFGGPDAYMLYQLGIFAYGELKLDSDTSLSGAVALRLADNYKHFVYDGPSQLPRVRTDIRQYLLTSWSTIPNLQLTHMLQVSDSQFVSVYGGLLEPMFSGAGAEWLYRPWHSPVSIGVDFNYVQQRAYEQDWHLKDYHVNTGQVTLYWDTGWNGLLTQLSVGQYLAGDRGVEIDLSRRFDNGVIIGAYASKTNVTAEEFGEGSFNKGIYVVIPFDDISPISMPGNAYFNWQPLLRDGGAKLARAYTLYGMTMQRR